MKAAPLLMQPSAVIANAVDLRLERSYIDKFSAVLAGGKYNYSVNESVNCVVFAHSDIESGMMHCATLALDDVARLGALTTKNLNTESFAFRLAAVL